VPVDYFDNHVLCEMIESDKKPFGLISVLNDCCMAPGDPTDVQFLGQLDSQFGSHPHYASFASSKSLGRTQFVVKHYAGDVAYTVDGFLDVRSPSPSSAPPLLPSPTMYGA
jgi:myosin-1